MTILFFFYINVRSLVPIFITKSFFFFFGIFQEGKYWNFPLLVKNVINRACFFLRTYPIQEKSKLISLSQAFQIHHNIR